MKNREIKFRAWHKLEKRMYLIEGIYSLHFGDPEFNPSLWKDEEVLRGTTDAIEILRFTGLLDKQGKEIYEDDILNVDWGIVPDSEKNIFKPKFVMEFRNYSWFPFSHGLPTPENIEVIGNVYENPELLNEKD